MEEREEVDHSLDQFRSQWRNEIKERKGQKGEEGGEGLGESLAAKLFMSAVELERKRIFYGSS